MLMRHYEIFRSPCRIQTPSTVGQLVVQEIESRWRIKKYW